MDIDRCSGVLLGLALGDAMGAPYEGGILERALWRVIGTTGGRMRWTDDTRMSIDLAESLIANRRIDQDDLAHRFAASYRWSRGYGPGTARVLGMIRRGQDWATASMRAYPGGSYGNGGAMRAPVVGVYFADSELPQIVEAAHMQAMVTHAHPLALDGSALIAVATAMSGNGAGPPEIMARLLECSATAEFREKLTTAQRWLEAGELLPPREVVALLGNGIAALKSVVTAIYVSLAHHNRSFEELLTFVIRLGGDVDTIAAMAGAIWGASRGAEHLPITLLRKLEAFERIEMLAMELSEATPQPSTGKGVGLEEIEREYLHWGSKQGNELWVWEKHADDFLEECRRRNLAVIGLDGAEISPERKMYHMDMIADFSVILRDHQQWQDVVDDCYRNCKVVLDDWHQESRPYLAITFCIYTERRWIRNARY